MVTDHMALNDITKDGPITNKITWSCTYTYYTIERFTNANQCVTVASFLNFYNKWTSLDSFFSERKANLGQAKANA